MKKSMIWSIALGARKAVVGSYGPATPKASDDAVAAAAPSKLFVELSAGGDAIATVSRVTARADALVFVRGPAVTGEPTLIIQGIRLVTVAAAGTGGDSTVVLLATEDRLVDVAVGVGESWAVDASVFVACCGGVVVDAAGDEDGRLTLTGAAGRGGGRAWLRGGRSVRLVELDDGQRLHVGEAGALLAVGDGGRRAYVGVRTGYSAAWGAQLPVDPSSTDVAADATIERGADAGAPVALVQPLHAPLPAPVRADHHHHSRRKLRHA